MTDLFTNPHRYGDLDAWRREAVQLHARGPIHRIEEPGYQPFLAVIGHDAVLDIERRRLHELHERGEADLLARASNDPFAPRSFPQRPLQSDSVGRR